VLRQSGEESNAKSRSHSAEKLLEELPLQGWLTTPARSPGKSRKITKQTPEPCKHVHGEAVTSAGGPIIGIRRLGDGDATVSVRKYVRSQAETEEKEG
jgi:hypothetical protein